MHSVKCIHSKMYTGTVGQPVSMQEMVKECLTKLAEFRMQYHAFARAVLNVR